MDVELWHREVSAQHRGAVAFGHADLDGVAVVDDAERAAAGYNLHLLLRWLQALLRALFQVFTATRAAICYAS